GEIGLGLLIARHTESGSFGRLLLDLAHAVLGDVEDVGIEPELRVGIGHDHRARKQALRGVDHADVDVVAIHGFADDERPGLARRYDVDTGSRGLGCGHIVYAEHGVVARNAGLALHDFQRSE